MQAKAVISFLSISIYLSSLAIFWNNRASEQSRIEAQQQELAHRVSFGQEIALLAQPILSTLEDRNQANKNAVARTTIKPVERKANLLIVDTITDFNRKISLSKAQELALLIEDTASRHRVDPLLVTALVSQESAFHDDAVSPVGAIGLGQLMPYTAADLGVDPHDPADNLDGSVRYLAQNLRQWGNNPDAVSLALASYNAGPGAVAHYKGVPPYEETQNYVAIIGSRYRYLKQSRLAAALGRETGDSFSS